jgi:penicillin-binding protein 1A
MQREAQNAIRRGLESTDHRRYPWAGPEAHVDPSRIDEEARLIQRSIVDHQHGKIFYWPPSRDDIPMPSVKLDPNKVYRAIITDNSSRDIAIKVGTQDGIIPPKKYQWIRQAPKRALAVGDIVLVHPTDEAGLFALTRNPKLQSALFSMDPHNGFVKAMVGGYDFALSEFNRATQAERQPGSSFKPFVYAAALDKGYTFNSTIMDTPVVFRVGKRSFWSPKNYGGGYKGPTPFENCIKFSRNVPTVKITFDIGMHYLDAFLRKMGITTQVDKYLSMALGANVVSLSEMVPAYSVFVADGAYHRPVTITKIVDNMGTVIEEIKEDAARKPQLPEPPTLTPEEMKSEDIKMAESVERSELNEALFDNQRGWIAKDELLLTDVDIKTLYGKSIPEGHVLTPQTAYMMVKLLRGVVLGGTGTRLRALGKPSGGKTGTTNDETDAWFMSIMPHLVTGVWVGFDEIKRIGYGATGGNTAAPIVLDYLQQVTKDLEGKEFEPPEGFPTGKLASLTGGSAVEGMRPALMFPGEFVGSDLAGEFFEQDMEFSGGVQDYGYEPPRSFRQPPPPSTRRPRPNARTSEVPYNSRSYPDF